MRPLLKLLSVQIKLYLREPVAAFFTLAFAPMMLVLFATIYGNSPNPLFGGLGTVDVSVPAYLGLVIVTVGLISIPISVAAEREIGVFRRLRVTPFSPFLYLVSSVLTNYLMTLLGSLLLVLIGSLAYHMHFQGNVLNVFLAFTLGSLSFFSLGYLLAAVAPSSRFAMIVGMVLAYPMMFLSGASIPLEILPSSLKEVIKFIPLTYVVTMMRGLWLGEPWGGHLLEVAVLVGMLVLGAILSVRFFRFE